MSNQIDKKTYEAVLTFVRNELPTLEAFNTRTDKEYEQRVGTIILDYGPQYLEVLSVHVQDLHFA